MLLFPALLRAQGEPAPSDVPETPQNAGAGEWRGKGAIAKMCIRDSHKTALRRLPDRTPSGQSHPFSRGGGGGRGIICAET